jgi:hypothetical protein
MAMGRLPSKPTIPVPRPVTFRAAGAEPRSGRVVRLSVVGVVVESPGVVAIGVPVDLVLELRPGRPMVCKARVQWSKPGCFGAQFTLLGARETHAIVEAMRAA